MELKFDQLLTYSIKRLSRPKFRHDTVHFNDPIAYQNFSEDLTLPSSKPFSIDDYDASKPQTPD